MEIVFFALKKKCRKINKEKSCASRSLGSEEIYMWFTIIIAMSSWTEQINELKTKSQLQIFRPNSLIETVLLKLFKDPKLNY